jgi:hypothetical protein
MTGRQINPLDLCEDNCFRNAAGDDHATNGPNFSVSELV